MAEEKNYKELATSVIKENNRLRKEIYSEYNKLIDDYVSFLEYVDASYIFSDILVDPYQVIIKRDKEKRTGTYYQELFLEWADAQKKGYDAMVNGMIDQYKVIKKVGVRRNYMMTSTEPEEGFVLRPAFYAPKQWGYPIQPNVTREDYPDEDIAINNEAYDNVYINFQKNNKYGIETIIRSVENIYFTYVDEWDFQKYDFLVEKYGDYDTWEKAYKKNNIDANLVWTSLLDPEFDYADWRGVGPVESNQDLYQLARHLQWCGNRMLDDLFIARNVIAVLIDAAADLAESEDEVVENFDKWLEQNDY